MRKVIGLLLTFATLARINVPQDPVDRSVIEDIKREAAQNSQVMDHAFSLAMSTDHDQPDHPDSVSH